MGLNAYALITVADAKREIGIAQNIHGNKFEVDSRSLTSNVATIILKSPHGRVVDDIMSVQIGESIYDGDEKQITAIADAMTFSFAKTHANDTLADAAAQVYCYDYELDDWLEQTINAATSMIEEYRGKPYLQRSFIEYPVGKCNDPYLILRYKPILSIESIIFGALPVWGSQTTEENLDDSAVSGIVWDTAELRNTGMIYRSSGWPEESEYTQVTGTYGFATSDTVPQEVKRLCMKMVKLEYFRSGLSMAGLPKPIIDVGFMDRLAEDIDKHLKMFPSVNV